MDVPSVELVRRWLPPHCIIHVGAGAGAGLRHVWRNWGIERVLLIDADRDRLACWAEPLVADRPGWRMAGATLADVDGELDFYRASNPSEDGLVAPQQLTGLWPNLHDVSRMPCPVRRLDAVMDEFESASLPAEGHVWAVIDCLPALPILVGAGERIAQWSVLWLRVLLHPTGTIGEGALLQGVAAFLEPLGFRCVDVQEGHHPSIGHALFVRDWRDALLEQAGNFQAQALRREQDCAEQLKTHEARVSDLTTTQRALEQERVAVAARRDALEQEVHALQSEQSQTRVLLGEQQQAVQDLASERSALLAQLAAKQADGDSLRKMHDEQVARRESAIEDLTRQCQEHSALAAQWQSRFHAQSADVAAQAGQIEAQREKWEVQSQQIETQREQIEASRAGHEELAGIAALRQSSLEALMAENLQLKAKLASLEAEMLQHSQVLEAAESGWREKEARFVRLESESSELERRQQGISDEMLRAGAQIDLIKDILTQGALLTDAELPARPKALAIKGEQKTVLPGRRRRSTKT